MQTYIIINAHDAETLMIKVNDAILSGYVPLGGVAVSHYPPIYAFDRFSQAMVSKDFQHYYAQLSTSVNETVPSSSSHSD